MRKKDLDSLGKFRCAQQQSPARLVDNEEISIIQNYLFNECIQKALLRLVFFTTSLSNESIWNVMGIYRDKTIHYKHYNVLYEMGYLDWNDNRLREICYRYQTDVRLEDPTQKMYQPNSV